MWLIKSVSLDYSELRWLALLRTSLHMSHDPIPKRTHVSIIKTHNETNFILIENKFLLTSPSLYKFINNINKMTHNIQVNYN
jgi:hypothetical protein